jgi:nicotinamide riboside transporter PnuC
VFLKNVPMFGEMDSQPFMDSITSVPAYIAQILMVL